MLHDKNGRGPVLSVSSPNSICIDDMALFADDLEAVMDNLDRLVALDTSSLVVTPNVDQIVLMAEDPSARTALAEARMRLIDGMPIVMLARLLGARNVNRHTGADVLRECVRESIKREWCIAVIGGSPESLAGAVANLRLANPGARLHAVNLPLLDDIDDPRSETSIRELTEIGPDLVFVCMGFPRQENWYLEWKGSLPVSVYIGVGAAVDFASGNKHRAPHIIQRCGLEWLFRLVQEPRRLAGRYLRRDVKFLPIVIRSIRLRANN